MNKLIYLYEFDSVKNLPKEIDNAHNILFDQIVMNGNHVVFAFNQLCDSLTLIKLLQDKQNFEVILTLFTKGILKISRYNQYRTASQYILNAIQKCMSENEESFYFSAIPTLSNDKTMLKKMNDALTFSDPNLLIEHAKQDEKNYETLIFLNKYVKFILAISQSDLTYTPVNPNTYNQFSKFIDVICNICHIGYSFSTPEINELFPQAVKVIERIKQSIVNIENRSNWLQELNKVKLSEDLKFICSEIIHLCYNYTVEDSVDGVFKNYINIDDDSFKEDFEKRLTLSWRSHQPNQNDNSKTKNTHINWTTALRIIEYVPQVPLLESFRRSNSLFSWYMLVFLGMFYKLLTIPIFVCGIIGIEYIVGDTVEYGSSFFVDFVKNEFLFKGILIGVGMFFASLLSNVSKMPDITESFHNLILITADLATIIKCYICNTIQRKGENNE